MADPFTLAATALGSSGVGSIISGVGAGISGLSAAGMYGYQSGISALNAKIAKQNADYAINAGETSAAISGMRTAAEVGQTRARQGASNIAVGQGSAADVVASERKIGGINQAIIRNNAARTAYGYNVEAMKDTMQAGMYNQARMGTLVATPLNVAGSLISGAGSVASKWYQGQSVGLFGKGAGVPGDSDLTYSQYGFNQA